MALKHARHVREDYIGLEDMMLHKYDMFVRAMLGQCFSMQHVFHLSCIISHINTGQPSTESYFEIGNFKTLLDPDPAYSKGHQGQLQYLG